ncbi:hypothetical protein NJ959_26600, partial [Symplocastrum sp. BBK-W-15]|nr:hypothetical protein [Limnofasciculus baicalensis BBK-W-15]
MAALINPAIPAAALVCPILAFIVPMAGRVGNGWGNGWDNGCNGCNGWGFGFLLLVDVCFFISSFSSFPIPDSPFPTP